MLNVRHVVLSGAVGYGLYMLFERNPDWFIDAKTSKMYHEKLTAQNAAIAAGALTFYALYSGRAEGTYGSTVKGWWESVKSKVSKSSDPPVGSGGTYFEGVPEQMFSGRLEAMLAP